MVARVRNLIKSDRKKSHAASVSLPTPKRQCRTTDVLMRRYPVVQSGALEDSDSNDQHKKAIVDEMSRIKPRESVLVPLMKLSYQNRWDFVCHQAQSVEEILQAYPALKRPSIVR